VTAEGRGRWRHSAARASEGLALSLRSSIAVQSAGRWLRGGAGIFGEVRWLAPRAAAAVLAAQRWLLRCDGSFTHM
jgi:hypothetical protein